MDSNTLLIGGAATLLAMAGMLYAGKSGSAGAPLPKGPPGLPLVGNLFEMPTEWMWFKLSDWAKEYGRVYYLRVLNQGFLVINDFETANALMDKRSLIYSSRPRFVMAGELSGYGRSFVLLPYGEEWRQQRKLVAPEFVQSSLSKYRGLQEDEARKMAVRLLEDPESLRRIVRYCVGSIIMLITFGYKAKQINDPFLDMAEETMENFAKAQAPGVWLVDTIPALKYLPTWMPGAGFLRIAKKYKALCDEILWSPYHWNRKNMETGSAVTPNVVGKILEHMGDGMSKEEELRLVGAASSIFGGGADTNASTLLSFFLAMTLHPEVQTQAQKELDEVLGDGVLPRISDRARLEYIDCIMAEVWRWNPPGPVGIPHVNDQDDVFEGMFIPKGTNVIGNAWFMLHDETKYEKPMDFNPGRFIGKPEARKHVSDILFGYGRRRCMGSQFAEATFFICVATVLSTCSVVPAPENKDVGYTGDGITFPLPYKFDIKPRSEKSRATLTQAVTE